MELAKTKAEEKREVEIYSITEELKQESYQTEIDYYLNRTSYLTIDTHDAKLPILMLLILVSCCTMLKIIDWRRSWVKRVSSSIAWVNWSMGSRTYS